MASVAKDTRLVTADSAGLFSAVVFVVVAVVFFAFYCLAPGGDHDVVVVIDVTQI